MPKRPKSAMIIDPDDYRLAEGKKVDLGKLPTLAKPVYSSKDDYETQLHKHVRRLKELQEILYASGRYALLVIFQGMDTAGKDGVIEHVMSGINPQGCDVHSFKEPSAEEMQHDFLWRSAQRLPARGRIGIFNRSYYEEVLVVRVHPDLLKPEGVEGGSGKHLWKTRYRSIVAFEEHLSRNGTRVVKIFLHLSKDEQRRRLLARIDDPQKNWKFNMVDVRERGFWKDYQAAYEDCLRATGMKAAPWYVVPADDKESARLIVSSIVLDALEGLKLSYPKVDSKRAAELKAIRGELEGDR